MDQGAQFQIVLVDDTSTPNEMPENPVRPAPEAPAPRPAIPVPTQAAEAPSAPSQPAIQERSTDRPAQVADTATPAKGRGDREDSPIPRDSHYRANQRIHPIYQAAIGVADVAGVGQLARAMIGTYEAVKGVALQLELQRKQAQDEAEAAKHAAARPATDNAGDIFGDFPEVQQPPEKPLDEEPEAFDRTLETAIDALNANTDPRHLAKLGDRLVDAFRQPQRSTQQTAPTAAKPAETDKGDSMPMPQSESGKSEAKSFPTAGTPSRELATAMQPDLGKKIDVDALLHSWNVELMGEQAAADWEQLGKTTMRLPKGWKPDPQPKEPAKAPEARQEDAPKRPASTETRPTPKAGAKPSYPDKIDPDAFLRDLKVEALGEDGAKHWDSFGRAESNPAPKAEPKPTEARKSWWPSIRRAKPAEPVRAPHHVTPSTGVASKSATAAITQEAATAAASRAPIAATGVTAAGPVVIAFAAVAAAAVGVGIGLKMLSDAARSQADELEQYSYAISKQRAETSVRRQLRDIERANERGETLAKIGGAQDRLGEAFQRLGDALLDPLIDILAELAPIIEGAAYGITKTAEGVNIGVDNVKLISAQINDWLNLAGTEAEQDAKVRAIEKRLAERWHEYLTDEKKKRLEDALKNDPMLDALNGAWGQPNGMDPQLMRELIAAVRAL